VLAVTDDVVAHLTGTVTDHDMDAALADMALSLPQPPPRQPVKTDIGAISLNMAQGCNLRCTYCFAGEGDYGNKGMMTAETAIAAIKFFTQDRKSFHVVFFGGEPLLNFSVIKDVVAWCETQPQVRFSFGLTTNGTLLTAEKLAWMKDKGIKLTVSYDGKGLQAKQRLNKDKTTNSETLVEKKLATFATQLGELREMNLRATIQRDNIEMLEEALLATLTSSTFKLSVSHHATPLRAFQFNEADVDKLGVVYKKVIDRFLAEEAYEKLLRLDNVKRYVKTIHAGKTRQYACGAGVNYLTVSVAGDFYLCHRFNEEEEENFGNVRDGLKRDRLDEIANFRNAEAEPCNSCWMKEWCAGGCFHEHKTASGSKFQPDPMYCKLQGLEIEQALRVYTILLAKAPHLLD
jgi:uncharacterized protein